ncbi:ATP-binding protein [Funiculus sociatus GB2-A5]|uniref:ATP-binding protein n=1 Tax=Funiculus sociatus GB2-A5 TaxID=2933946 RepID=A0ABV0JUJ1_9CYAN|nr:MULTISPECIES: ATP-binding protein [unclassified Trichocoleus]MBD1904065.1 ATP-binding protein [Trichocoleus sp. FACHB-832]MBD2063928.1 ATP-binding protein [Trichocoleus sp. FACHB-6]
MDTQAIASIKFLQRQAASLLLYKSVLAGEVGSAFLNLLQALCDGDTDGLVCLQAYGSWFQALAAKNQSWENYLITQILRTDNPFTRQVQQASLLSPALVAAAQHDLQALQSLYNCSSDQLSRWVQAAAKLPAAPVAWNQQQDGIVGAIHELPIRDKFQILENWAEALEYLATHYHDYGTGLFAEYRAFRWQSGQLVGIRHPDPVKLTELVGYESQREALLKNTKFLLAGYPALHVLLYGSRGSGKSSLVKGLLNESGTGNLRLVEVAKSDLRDLSEIVEQLRGVPQKFVIFVDDLSFEEDDDAFKALKVVLEGNLTARSQNVVVYATSNRRHLIREFFADRPLTRDNEEIHAWDTVQEKLSFSDRFGLTLTFEPADQNTYLNIIRHLAAQAEIPLSEEDLEYRALQWATRHNGRSGRTARQFIDFLKADLNVNT